MDSNHYWQRIFMRTLPFNYCQLCHISLYVVHLFTMCPALMHILSSSQDLKIWWTLNVRHWSLMKSSQPSWKGAVKTSKIFTPKQITFSSPILSSVKNATHWERRGIYFNSSWRTNPRELRDWTLSWPCIRGLWCSFLKTMFYVWRSLWRLHWKQPQHIN